MNEDKKLHYLHKSIRIVYLFEKFIFWSYLNGYFRGALLFISGQRVVIINKLLINVYFLQIRLF